MIEFVKGRVDHIKGDTITIENNGIGYLIYCSNPFVFNGQQPEEETVVYTYQYVKEDVNRLYGFRSRKERELFEQLLQVSGIGPKGAQAILASGDPGQVVGAIENEDETFLTKFPGVGKKTAKQMIIDLKGKLTGVYDAVTIAGAPVSLLDEQQPGGDLEEALEALAALGYGEKEIKKVRPHLEKEELSADEYVRKALQWMLT
ncbi:Holliday junction branch migration protein RuvA [Marinococcus halophilus]|uniref:Holliday junction branch migration complex subunit RuvA n=1 Tax=Marinococcus halophilus TaxID=1371 RepID=A0A510Y6M8_MARHA|nr:Holliday junction branch migration protein RuvA [Marinococcus halophilus]OZT81104.1 Holliday junction branch migration protein RuvA [Marinococcus halophilus]GEK58823.1 Holliday junction ATP-dependent DNA helicase RuvA [Marinococcus halophilus]